MPYTCEEAERRIPFVLKRLALEAIDALMVLDSYSMRSREFEKRIMAIRGYNAYLHNLSHIIWKTPKEEWLKTH